MSSDFIIGFPGETDHDFQNTMRLIEEINFDASFSFIYSKRPGTPASDMPDDVPVEIKKQRLKILQDRINQQTMQNSRRLVETTQRILVTDFSKKDPGQLQGRTAIELTETIISAHNLNDQTSISSECRGL
jgi:tRNA-2-methylthio-N6-dimethylallyladenosine synthase